MLRLGRWRCRRGLLMGWGRRWGRLGDECNIGRILMVIFCYMGLFSVNFWISIFYIWSSLNWIFINVCISSRWLILTYLPIWLYFSTDIAKNFLRLSILCSIFLNKLIRTLSNTINEIFDCQIKNKRSNTKWYDNPKKYKCNIIWFFGLFKLWLITCDHLRSFIYKIDSSGMMWFLTRPSKSSFSTNIIIITISNSRLNINILKIP